MTRRGAALFLLLSVLWGLPYLFIKLAVAEVSVPFVVFVRSALGMLVLLPFAWSQFRPVLQHWRPVLAFAVIEMVVPQGMVVHAEVHISSSMAGLLVAATPILTVILGRWGTAPEPLDLSRSVGLAFGFIGVGALAIPEFGGDLLSILEVLLAGACYAAGSLIAGRWLGAVPAVPMTATCLGISALCYLIPATAHWPTAWPSAQATGALVALGAACTAAAFACFFLLIREIGSERAVVITYVAPAVAIASGVVLLGEPLDARMLAAFAFILTGSWLATGAGRSVSLKTGTSHDMQDVQRAKR